MKMLLRFIIILFFQCSMVFSLHSQDEIDSLLSKRTQSMIEYTSFKNSLTERTWLNLVILNEKAEQLIKDDHFILEFYLPRLVQQKAQIQNEMSELNHQLELTKVEMGHLENELEEKKDVQQFFLFGLIAFFLLSVLLLILYIERYLKYRQINNLLINYNWDSEKNSLIKEIEELKVALAHKTDPIVSSPAMDNTGEEYTSQKLKEALLKEKEHRKLLEVQLQKIIDTIN